MTSAYQPIHIDTLLNPITWNDTRFHANYSLDPYKNCELCCLYCDSGYDQTILIKTNAVEILQKELRKNKGGRILIGTVHDPYQPAENTYHLTRKILATLIKQQDYSIHLLTKTTAILNDIDLLKQINDPQITISLSTTDVHLSARIEPKIPSPTKRLQAIKKLREADIAAGLSLMPIIPGLTDQNLEATIQEIAAAQPSYLLHKHLELKGDQQTHFKHYIQKHYPHLTALYEKLYFQSYQPADDYIKTINSQITSYCLQNNLSQQVPKNKS